MQNCLYVRARMRVTVCICRLIFLSHFIFVCYVNVNEMLVVWVSSQYSVFMSQSSVLLFRYKITHLAYCCFSTNFDILFFRLQLRFFFVFVRFILNIFRWCNRCKFNLNGSVFVSIFSIRF